MNIHQQAVIDAAVEWAKPHQRSDDYSTACWVLRAAVTRMQSAAPEPLWRHKKTGGVYRVLTNVARMEVNGMASAEYVVYQNVNTGDVWMRAADQFYDGRFSQEAQAEGREEES